MLTLRVSYLSCGSLSIQWIKNAQTNGATNAWVTFATESDADRAAAFFRDPAFPGNQPHPEFWKAFAANGKRKRIVVKKHRDKLRTARMQVWIDQQKISFTDSEPLNYISTFWSAIGADVSLCVPFQCRDCLNAVCLLPPLLRSRTPPMSPSMLPSTIPLMDPPRLLAPRERTRQAMNSLEAWTVWRTLWTTRTVARPWTATRASPRLVSPIAPRRRLPCVSAL